MERARWTWVCALLLGGCGGGDPTGFDGGGGADGDADADADPDGGGDAGGDDTDSTLCDETAGDQFLWAKVIGGEGADALGGIAATADGAVAITGWSDSAPATFGEGASGVVELSAENGPLFLVKYDDDGGVLWATQFGGTGWSRTWAIDSAADGRIFVAGNYSGDDFLLGAGEPGETVLPAAAGRVAYVAKFDAAGDLLWARVTSGGSGCEHWPNAVAALPDGGAVIAGDFSDGSITFGAGEGGETTFTSLASDGFVAAYGTDGDLRWARRVGGDGSAGSVAGVAAFADGGALVGGSFYGAPLLLGEGEENETELVDTGEGDPFYAKYGEDGALLWARQAAGDYAERIADVATLPDGSFFLLGEFSSVSMLFDPGEPTETQVFPSQVSPIFAARFAPDATVTWAVGGGCGEYAGLFDADVYGDESVVGAGWCEEAMTTTDEQPPPPAGVAFGFSPEGSWEKAPWVGNEGPTEAVAVAGDGTGAFVFGGAIYGDAWLHGTGCVLPLPAISGADIYLVRVAP